MSNECSVMETKSRYRLPDDAEISNQNEYESEKEKQQSKKRKITQDDTASKLAKKIKSHNASKSSYLPLQIMCSVKQESKRQGERAIEIESESVDDTNIGEKYVSKKKIERDVIGVRPTNTKNSHLPLKVMCSEMEEKRIGTRPAKTKNSHLSLQVKCSVIEEKRGEIDKIREIGKVKNGEEKMIKKEGHQERMAFWARVRAAEFLDDPRGLLSTTVADVKNLLQGKSHNELKVLQSEIQLQMGFGSANDVEYWETVLKLIHIYKVKACLDIHAKIYGKFYGQKYRNLSNAASDGKIDQAGTEEAEGTGSSCSPELLHGEGTGSSCSPVELLHGEEVGDNFEMMITL